MRLLHSKKRVFQSFDGDSVPPYATLSHTWGSKEVTHQEMVAWIQADKEGRSLYDKRDFRKIDLTCNQARYDGIDWVWIDTCNIDKSSSSELSEAINSMFQWYKNADMCYVYLEDINYQDLKAIYKDLKGSQEGIANYNKLRVLRSARWFSRGWTLQELIASEKIRFYCAIPGSTRWSFIGSKESELDLLATITGIDKAVLEQPDLLSTMSVARRMSWAAFRETTRPEDIAYCLLGVFQVNMPLLYGEGSNAFIRLQEEILKNSEDESLFAWTEQEVNKVIRNDGILASHPRAFSESSEIVPYASKLEPYAMTNRGLRI
ncbi:HET-domain-containing protein, partial [Phaeosphaeriaceae sp. SRC1lsM3a]